MINRVDDDVGITRGAKTASLLGGLYRDGRQCPEGQDGRTAILPLVFFPVGFSMASH